MIDVYCPLCNSHAPADGLWCAEHKARYLFDFRNKPADKDQDGSSDVTTTISTNS